MKVVVLALLLAAFFGYGIGYVMGEPPSLYWPFYGASQTIELRKEHYSALYEINKRSSAFVGAMVGGALVLAVVGCRAAIIRIRKSRTGRR